MKKLLVPFVVLAFSLGACAETNKNNELPPTYPTTQASETIAPTKDSDPTETPSTPREDPPIEGEENYTPKPSESASSDVAAPPATQFAKRWGDRYPNVPEFAILKAANATCRVIEEAGNGWQDNTLLIAGIGELLKSAGINSDQGLEFAQDAEQNYCSSVSNPT